MRLSPLSLYRLSISLFACALLASCGSSGLSRNHAVVSIKDQKLRLIKDGDVAATYPVSTSKFGYSSRRGSNHTPLGKHAVAAKIGGGHRSGTVFKSRRPTGEVLRPNAPGRDPIVSRILWLKGLESRNRNTYSRYIYIHGTPAERKIGTKASYGCIRMKSKDVIDLYNNLGVGSRVTIQYRGF